MKNTIKLGKKVIIFISICMGVSFASCQNKIIKIEQEKKNPVEYIFSCSKDSLHNVISKQLEINNLMVWDSKHGSMVLKEISHLFSQNGNSSDFCLESIDYIGKSKTYFATDGAHLDYRAWFYLHLEAIDKANTRIKITTIEPKVIVGRELLPTPPHFVRRDKTIAVEPSTIEEYEILLKIGDLVGEKDMPPLILPERK
jgi:hypothetical protein